MERDSEQAAAVALVLSSGPEKATVTAMVSGVARVKGLAPLSEEQMEAATAPGLDSGLVSGSALDSEPALAPGLEGVMEQV